MLPHPADPGSMIKMISLDRKTESECMVVTAGSCDSNESLRLAYMSLDESQPPEQGSPMRTSSATTGTSSSKSSKSGSERMMNGSSSSNQSSIGPEEAAFSRLGGISETVARGLDEGKANGDNLERNHSPPLGSPFNSPIAQQGEFDVVSTPATTRERLDALATNPELFKELSRLPSNDVVIYLQVAEDAKALITAQKLLPAKTSEMATSHTGGLPSAPDREQLQGASEKLVASLPLPTLEKLRPFKYYGLLDVIIAPTQ